jgi:LCP family protein required for cell wall assembly
MPWHRATREPRAHWIVLALGLTGLLAALVLGGIARHPGVGTTQPGRLGDGGYAPTIVDPVIPAAGGQPIAHRLPDRTVALTFDDGPDPVWTPLILDALRRHGVTATFFVVGARVNEYPELVRRVLAEGHEIGLHSFSHRNLVDLPAWEQLLELDLTRTAVAQATGRDIRLFRPPFLGTPADVDPPSRQVIDLAAAHGYTTVLGDLDTKDWLHPKRYVIAGSAAPFGDNGAIIVMHDGGGDRTETLAALETILPALARRGFHCVTVSAGLATTPAAPLPVVRAGNRDRVRGWALAQAQRVAGWISDLLSLLLIPATVLAVSRMAIQVACAWRHARRRRALAPAPMSRPPISVVVPAHNEAANIVATVRSLVRNRYPDLEVLVVDDGSTDGTADLVEKADLPGVRVIRQHNSGKAAALRRGIAEARHDLLVMIDGDTIVEPETLVLLVQPLLRAEVGAVAGNAKVANRGGVLGRWQHLEYVITFNLDRRVFEVAECMPTVPGALGAFRREALVAAGGVNAETLAEDTDLTMAVCRAGWLVVYEDKARAWTEAPGTWGGLWRQRYRWCYGTMQAMWKHRASLREPGASGKLGRRGLTYVFLYQILQPLLAPIVDIYLIYTVLFQPVSWAILLWLSLHAAQLAVAAYAFRLDREQVGPLWTFLFQQVVYRQLIYLVVIQSAVTAVLGARLRWHQPARTGQAAALTANTASAARIRTVMWRMRAANYRDPGWARLCVWAGVTLVAVSAVAYGGTRILAQRYSDALHQADLLGSAASYVDVGRIGAAPLNVLLIGVDWRMGQTGLARADTIMVMHIPRGADRAYLFSLPRDTLVDIPALAETGYRGGRDRLNAAFAYGAGAEQERARGGRLLAETLKRRTGLPGFGAAALIDFYGFNEVVQTLGDIEMCIDVDTKSNLSGVLYERGCRRLDAASALDYVRQRKSVAGGDYARQRHQQQFIKAIVREVQAQGMLTDPSRLDELIRATAGALTVSTGPVEPIAFLFALRHISPDRITLIRTPGHSAHDDEGRYLGEELLPVADELFQAARADTLDQFVGSHPELVNRDS